ncbi:MULTISPECIES: glycosyltransferase [unclassified Alcanivorax]|uniref:glycosyltransferase n=1 Tax=unclassified Alcanivorax TaxID=2638842 RepID=UPI0009EF4DDE|nr:MULTISPECIES: glycosyltransferase [unclassified Alcanivorax]
MMNATVTVGIDASNITGGGGLKHLVEILKNASPEESGIGRVVVWGIPGVLPYLPERPWLELVPIEWFDKSVFHRQVWRRVFLPKEVDRICDVLFVPGGISLAVNVPDVVMSQNMQPFLPSERRSAGLGKARLRVELLRFLQGWSFQKASARLFLTNYAAETIGQQFPFADVNNEIIPHGIDPDFFCSYTDRKSWNSNDIKICYVSTLNTYKHQIEVIDAISLLAEKYPSLNLFLFGSEASRYGEKVRKKIASTNDAFGREVVSYLGKVSFESLPEVYRSSDIVVFASSCENLPNILLESMASSSPVVCSDFQPMPSILKDAGLYCDVESPESIANAIGEFIESEALRAEKGRAASALASDYSWPRASKLTFDFFARVARNHEGFLEERR